MDSKLLAPDFREQPWWWDDDEPPARGESLPGRAEVAVVGGGHAGLSAALTLARLGHRPVLIEAGRIGRGAAARGGGVVRGGLRVSSGDLETRFGAARAREIALAAAAALPFLEALIEREGLDCAYRRDGRLVLAWTRSHLDALRRRAPHLSEITGLPARVLERGQQREAIGSDHYRGGLLDDAAGGLHPAQFSRGLAEAAARAGAVLVDDLKVERIGVGEGGGHVLETARGRLRADSVLVTVDGHVAGASGGSVTPWLAFPAPSRPSFAMATEYLGPAALQRMLPGGRMAADTQSALNRFRATPDGGQLLWSGRAAPGTTPLQAATALHRALREVFPALREVRLSRAWKGDDAATEALPHIGRREGVHYAAGCRDAGVAVAAWLGHQAALRIAGAAEPRFALADLPGDGAATEAPHSGPASGGWRRLRDRLFGRSDGAGRT